jgi:glutamate racemase
MHVGVNHPAWGLALRPGVLYQGSLMMDQTPLNDLPVGVFDSGIGGLTVLRELRLCLPNESFVYLGDTARVPYGNRSANTVIRYARMACGLLTSGGIKALIVACNTVSAVALDIIRVEYDLPVLGVIDPPARAACEVAPAGRIGVLGTRRTITSGAYERAIKQADSRCEVYSSIAPMFVPLAEEGWVTGDVPELVARRYLEPLTSRGIDALLLGCTHYPLLVPTLKVTLRDLTGRDVPIVDSAASVARETAAFLGERGLARGNAAGCVRFHVTDNPEAFAEVGSRFLRDDLSATDVQLVDL